MAIPAAAAHGTTMSFGCIGNRVYTGITDDHIYLMGAAAIWRKSRAGSTAS
jgi:hypothetical protein